MCSMELTWNIYETWVKATLRQKLSNHSGGGSHLFVIQCPRKSTEIKERCALAQFQEL